MFPPTTPPGHDYWHAYDDLTAWLTEHAPDVAEKLANEWSVPARRQAVDPRIDNGLDLNVVESVALTVALVDLQNGQDPTPGHAKFCVLGLARVTGRYDWTEGIDTATQGDTP